MEVSFGFVIAMISLLTFSLRTGWMALRLKRKFWPWFVVGLLLPFIGVVIILCLPVKKKKVKQPLLKLVSSEEIFAKVLKLEEPRRITGSEIQFPTRA